MQEIKVVVIFLHCYSYDSSNEESKILASVKSPESFPLTLGRFKLA